MKKVFKVKKNSLRPYNLKLPIPKITHEKDNKKEKVFEQISKSKHLGYRLPDL